MMMPLPRIEPVTIKAGGGWLDLDLRELWRYRELLFFLVWRDLKVRYSQAWLGIAWAVLQPLLTLVVLTLVFSVLAGFDSNGLPYPLYAFAALLPWTLFADAARRGALGLVGDAELVRKIYFPRLVIPTANVIAAVADFAIAFVLMLLLMAWYGIRPGWTLLLLPLLVLMLMGMAMAFALWLGPMNVRFHDISHTLPVIFQVWMYATPIVYPLSIVPQEWRVWYSLNPMVGIVEGFRWSLLGAGDINVSALAMSSVFIGIAFTGGLVFFRRAERTFSDFI